MWLFKTASATHWEGKFLWTRSASISLGSIWMTNRFRAAAGNSVASPASDTATASSGSGWELTTTTFLPLSAQRNARARLREVLPTPPFPQKTMILDCMRTYDLQLSLFGLSQLSIHRKEGRLTIGPQ